MFAGFQQENVYGFWGGFLWVRIMEDKFSEHSSNFCQVCFAGKMLANNILYIILCTLYYVLKRMKEEQGLLIKWKKEPWTQQWLNLWL